MPGDRTIVDQIRRLLRDQGETYPKEAHRELKEWCEERDYQPPSYDAVRQRFYLCRRAGLIESAGTAASGNPGAFDRSLYRMSPGVDPDDDRWGNVQGEVYPDL